MNSRVFKILIDIQTRFFKILLVSVCVSLFLIMLNSHYHIYSFNALRNNLQVKESVSFLSFNVRSSDSNFNQNQISIGQLIIDENPDVVYLCEFSLSRSIRLDSLLCSFGYERSYISGTNSIFYSKLSIEKVEEIVSDANEGVHSYITKAYANYCNQTILIVGCHLSSSRKDILKGYQRRITQAKAIVSNIREETCPIFVLGDFNDIYNSKPLLEFQNIGLKDSWWDSGFGFGFTFHSYGLLLRIDHVFYDEKHFRLNNIKVIETELSDHNAIYSNFSRNEHINNNRL